MPLATLDEIPELDLTIDGADEIDSSLRLIKGGGGALLREKIVAAASRRMLVIADSAKLVARLGAFPLPIEVVPFGLAATRSARRARQRRSRLGGIDRTAPPRRARFSSPTAGTTSWIAPSARFRDPRRSPARSRSFPASSTMACSSAWRAPPSSRGRTASKRSARSLDRHKAMESEIVSSFPIESQSVARRSSRSGARERRRPRAGADAGRAELRQPDPRRHRHEGVARSGRAGDARTVGTQRHGDAAGAEGPAARDVAGHRAGIRQDRGRRPGGVGEIPGEPNDRAGAQGHRGVFRERDRQEIHRHRSRAHERRRRLARAPGGSNCRRRL